MTSFGEQDHIPSNFNLEQIKDLLEKDSSDYLRGADDKNLGWILRDSSISGSLPTEGKNNDDLTKESTTRISPVSSHLSANISNTNEAVSNKTKATISPIHEEVVSPSKSVPDLASTSLANNRRRSSISSNGSNGTGASGGFLNKLKGKFSLKAVSPPLPQASNSVFKDNYSMNPTTRSRSSSVAGPKAADTNQNGYELKKTISTPAYSELSSDPRLDEYVKLYRRNSERPSRRNSCITNLPEKTNTKTETSISQKFSFLKRRSSIQVGNLNLHQERSSSETFENELIGDILDVCNTLKPLRRVGFHLQTFLIDPPQQIPSRNPRKGNVEIGPNGELIIKALSEEDKKAIEKSQLGQGGGLVVGGSGTLGLIKPSGKSETDESENDIEINKHARSVAIDKPMFTHERHNYKLPVERMALDVMYTRCCHLREILPIPAILKQIPKGSIAPLPILQMRNPTPTIIEVETFADFIRIAPILCVSLDGVSLSIDQFKSILAAICSKTQLQKLSLRNCPINSEGWSLLCLLLSQNKTIEKLDITQCPSLAVDIMKKKKKSSTNKKKEEEVIRMTCNKENRSDMNWTLFTATLIARGGIEELILTGCCINDLEIFEKLVKRALLIKTNRLSLAYNNLSVKQLKIVIDNWVFKQFVRGLDLGYNDFLSVKFLNIWLEMKTKPDFEELISNSTINFLSLNATNLRFSKTFTEYFESVLLRLPSLKYLDLSNNCRLFGTRRSLVSTPTKVEIDSSSDKSESSSTSKEHEMSEESIISYFTMKFPLFPKLIRLHIENNNFGTSSLISIANTLPYCKSLVYISLIGNDIQMNAGAALIQGLKNSKSLITLDANFDKFPTIFKERVGLYGMRNLERLYLNKTRNQSESDQFDTSKLSLTEQLNQILIKKAEKKLDLNSPEVVSIVKKANKIRQELTQTVNELLSMQLKNELNLEGKETLIRFVYINASIAKGLQLIDSSLVSQDENNDSVLFHLSHENEAKKQNLEHNNDPEPANISTVHTPTALSRSASKPSLQERQEGSVLKLLKLHNFHNPDEEFYNDMSGDEIRDKLCNTNFRDLDNTIDYLVELKKKGVSMGKIFNMDSKSDYLSKLKVKLSTEIQERLHDLCEIDRNSKSKESNQSSDNSEDTSVNNKRNDDENRNDDSSPVSNGSKNGKLQSGSKVNFDLFENKAGPEMEDNVNQSDNGEMINQLYDEVLNTLPFLQK